MEKRIINITLVLILTLMLTSCTANYTTDNLSLDEMLTSQIDITSDEFLSSVPNDYMDMLVLDTIHYGSFTAKDANEMFITFKIKGTPHIAGLDRTITAVYNADTQKIILQKTFVADIVSIYFLPDNGLGIQDILFLGDVTYQGYTTYMAKLYSLKGEKWELKSLPIENKDKNLAYAITSNRSLHIFKLGYNEYGPIFDYIDTFYWDTASGVFVKNSP